MLTITQLDMGEQEVPQVLGIPTLCSSNGPSSVGRAPTLRRALCCVHVWRHGAPTEVMLRGVASPGWCARRSHLVGKVQLSSGTAGSLAHQRSSSDMRPPGVSRRPLPEGAIGVKQWGREQAEAMVFLEYEGERGQKGRGKGQDGPPCHWSLSTRIHLDTGRQGPEVTKT